MLCARLRAAPSGAAGPDGAAQAGITAALATLSAQIKAVETQIAGQLAAHPDGHIFTSPARNGAPRPAARRDRRLPVPLPGPGSLAGLAGVAPVTRRSGKHTSHHFRWAVNRQLRDAVCDFAADSRHAAGQR